MRPVRGNVAMNTGSIWRKAASASRSARAAEAPRAVRRIGTTEAISSWSASTQARFSRNAAPVFRSTVLNHASTITLDTISDALGAGCSSFVLGSRSGDIPAIAIRAHERLLNKVGNFQVNPELCTIGRGVVSGSRRSIGLRSNFLSGLAGETPPSSHPFARSTPSVPSLAREGERERREISSHRDALLADPLDVSAGRSHQRACRLEVSAFQMLERSLQASPSRFHRVVLPNLHRRDPRPCVVQPCR